MQALISPEQIDRIAQVEPDDKVFPVAEPLYWTPCPDDCDTSWTHVDGQFIPPNPIVAP
ncbi:hypothetical protein UFOVP118_70 [uncultured Caudovirales phage]|uniref:Uncharacterized protein n=1 Tax=uncultured Caudovirales phage TaxID=2100421 RepID=A0A6J5LCN5_9CAUD|nr:hypothetical protein UFOVP118_70 [uncultured Caudovirales phage]